MNRDDRGILVGMVLGDGCIRHRQRQNHTGNTWWQSELRVTHSIKQRDYAEHKAELIRRMFGGKCNLVSTSTTLSNRDEYPQVRFTKSNSYFATLHRVLYPGGKKRYTRQVLDYLTPHGIAIWYMDDGTARVNRNKDGWVSSCSTEIATCCTEEEAQLIADYFLDEHDIKIKSFSSKGLWSVRMNTGQSQRFAAVIEPFVIDSMRYKLSHVSNLNLHECRTPVGNCAQCAVPIYDTRRSGLCTACYSRTYYRDVRSIRDGRVPNKARRVMR